MKRYEYRIKQVPNAVLHDLLDEMGYQGWRTVSVIDLGTGVYKVIFEKEVFDEG